MLRQQLGEFDLRLGVKRVAHVPELARLLGKSGDEVRMSMAERIHSNPAGKIEISLAVFGDHIADARHCGTG